MSLLKDEGFPGDGGRSQVQDAPTEQIGGDKVAHRAKANLPKDILIATHQAAVIFYEQEVKEAGQRGPDGMPPEVVELHQKSLDSSMAALVELGAVEMIDSRPETEAQETREAPVPVAALPELVPVAA